MSPKSTIPLHSGNTMPVIGLGTWELNKDTAAVIRQAIDMGYRMIDTSSDYGTQPEVGEAVNTCDIDRNELFIVTKVEETDDAYEAAKDYVEEMDVDYADLILIHRPPEGTAGEELWRGLIQARDEGITRDIGVSNYPIELMQQLIESTDEIPTVNQIEWTPFGHSADMMDFCDENGIVIQAYSPLTRGLRLDDEELKRVAKKYSKTPAQILLRWNLQLGTAPLPKANQVTHLKENISIFDFELSLDDMALLGKLNEEYSALGRQPQYV